MQAFAQLRQGLFLKPARHDQQQRVADQRQIGQQCGIARARAILTHQGIAPPVVAHFHPAPMSANQLQPLSRRRFPGQRAGEVIARFGAALAGLLDHPLAAHHDQGAGVGKVRGERFDREGVQAPGLHAAVAALAVGKNGVSCNAPSP